MNTTLIQPVLPMQWSENWRLRFRSLPEGFFTFDFEITEKEA
jgi:hypothetical protein